MKVFMDKLEPYIPALLTWVILDILGVFIIALFLPFNTALIIGVIWAILAFLFSAVMIIIFG
jgi:hypothetical protein